jgi:hypothetical protein
MYYVYFCCVVFRISCPVGGAVVLLCVLLACSAAVLAKNKCITPEDGGKPKHVVQNKN